MNLCMLKLLNLHFIVSFVHLFKESCKPFYQDRWPFQYPLRKFKCNQFIFKKHDR